MSSTNLVELPVQSLGPTKALEIATKQFIKSNPKSKEVFNNASKHLPAGNTRTTLFAPPFPIAAVDGSGSKIVSADGKTYLDMTGEYTAGIYGHSHPKIIEALQQGLGNGLNLGATSPLEGELAGLIKKRFEVGSGLELLRFTNSGTEANLMAVATARVWTGRNKVMVFTTGYHGSALSFSKGSEPTNIPGEYLVAKYNSISSSERVLERIEADSLAAILVEPMQGAGGSFPASLKFLKYLREQATNLGSLLIFDEVMTSRLYYAGGLSGKYRIKPDLITMGKYLGGGMSFGLFGGRRDIMSLYDPRAGGYVSSEANSAPLILTHSGTFNNNLMTMRAGIAGSKILTANVLEDLNSLGDYLRESLLQIFIRHNILPSCAATPSSHEPDIDTVTRGSMWISGIGSINTIHFGHNDEDTNLRDLFYFYLIENGIYLSRRGFIALNIVHTKDDMNHFVSVTEKFVKTWNEILRHD